MNLTFRIFRIVTSEKHDMMETGSDVIVMVNDAEKSVNKNRM